VIGFNTEHVEWQGCSLHDLIQPAFSFLVGAALPFSIASRKLKGQTFGPMLGHAIRRAFILIFLGIFLRSLHSSQNLLYLRRYADPDWPGICLPFPAGIHTRANAGRQPRSDLILFWVAFVLYPVPSPGFDYARVGVPQNWAASLHRISFSLEQEFQSFVGVRCLVPESVSHECIRLSSMRAAGPR